MRRYKEEWSRESGPAGKGQDGAALVTTLLLLVILTALGLAAIMTSTTEVMMSRNDRLNKVALNNANAGVATAIAKLDSMGAGRIGSDGTVGTVNPADKWYFSAGSGDLASITGVFFNVSAYYKTEDSFHKRDKATTGVADGEIVSYTRNCGYNNAPIDSYLNGFPVYHIVSASRVIKGGIMVASAKVEVDVVRSTFNIEVPGGLYSQNCPTISGSGNTLTGGDTPGLLTGDGACTPGGDITGTPSGVKTNNFLNMSTFLGFPVGDMAKHATLIGSRPFTNPNPPHDLITLDNGGTYPNLGAAQGFGSYSTNPAIIYIDNATKLTLNNLQGYGILVTTGDLDLGAGTKWYGFVYCMGDLNLSGGAGQPCNITGGAMAQGSSNVLNGNVEIGKNQHVVDRIARQGFKSRVINWKRIYD